MIIIYWNMIVKENNKIKEERMKNVLILINILLLLIVHTFYGCLFIHSRGNASSSVSQSVSQHYAMSNIISNRATVQESTSDHQFNDGGFRFDFKLELKLTRSDLSVNVLNGEKRNI